MRIDDLMRFLKTRFIIKPKFAFYTHKKQNYKCISAVQHGKGCGILTRNDILVISGAIWMIAF